MLTFCRVSQHTQFWSTQWYITFRENDLFQYIGNGAKCEPWNIVTERRRLSWLGHMMRMNPEAPSRQWLKEALKPVKGNPGRIYVNLRDVNAIEKLESICHDSTRGTRKMTPLVALIARCHHQSGAWAYSSSSDLSPVQRLTRFNKIAIQGTPHNGSRQGSTRKLLPYRESTHTILSVTFPYFMCNLL